MAKRIYKVVVKDQEGKAVETSLVRALTKITAAAHVFNKRVEAEAATADDVAALLAEGVKIEDATLVTPAAPAEPATAATAAT